MPPAISLLATEADALLLSRRCSQRAYRTAARRRRRLFGLVVAFLFRQIVECLGRVRLRSLLRALGWRLLDPIGMTARDHAGVRHLGEGNGGRVHARRGVARDVLYAATTVKERQESPLFGTNEDLIGPVREGRRDDERLIERAELIDDRSPLLAPALDGLHELLRREAQRAADPLFLDDLERAARAVEQQHGDVESLVHRGRRFLIRQARADETALVDGELADDVVPRDLDPSGHTAGRDESEHVGQRERIEVAIQHGPSLYVASIESSAGRTGRFTRGQAARPPRGRPPA